MTQTEIIEHDGQTYWKIGDDLNGSGLPVGLIVPQSFVVEEDAPQAQSQAQLSSSLHSVPSLILEDIALRDIARIAQGKEIRQTEGGIFAFMLPQAGWYQRFVAGAKETLERLREPRYVSRAALAALAGAASFAALGGMPITAGKAYADGHLTPDTTRYDPKLGVLNCFTQDNTPEECISPREAAEHPEREYKPSGCIAVNYERTHFFKKFGRPGMCATEEEAQQFGLDSQGHQREEYADDRYGGCGRNREREQRLCHAVDNSARTAAYAQIISGEPVDRGRTGYEGQELDESTRFQLLILEERATRKAVMEELERLRQGQSLAREDRAGKHADLMDRLDTEVLPGLRDIQRQFRGGPDYLQLSLGYTGSDLGHGADVRAAYLSEIARHGRVSHYLGPMAAFGRRFTGDGQITGETRTYNHLLGLEPHEVEIATETPQTALRENSVLAGGSYRARLIDIPSFRLELGLDALLRFQRMSSLDPWRETSQRVENGEVVEGPYTDERSHTDHHIGIGYMVGPSLQLHLGRFGNRQRDRIGFVLAPYLVNYRFRGAPPAVQLNGGLTITHDVGGGN